jgi:TetR/AcrR family transcriptional regulator, regulator of autoinduction and epiphytic fitness
VDGRAARGAKNRRAVIDATLALIEEGDLQPTAQAIASRAGVSTRSVFHHFDDLESLYADVADTQATRHWALLGPVAGGLAERIEAVVAQRARLYEEISSTRRAALLHEHESAVLAERLRESRAALRAHLRRNLPELAQLGRPAREGAAAVASWETWEALRRHQGLSIEAARAAVAEVLSALVVAVNV